MTKKIKLNGRSLNDAMYLLSITSTEAAKITGLSQTTVIELCKQAETEVHKKTYCKLSQLFVFRFTKDNVATVDKVKRFQLFGKREVILKHVPAEQEENKSMKNYLIYGIMAGFLLGFCVDNLYQFIAGLLAGLLG